MRKLLFLMFLGTNAQAEVYGKFTGKAPVQGVAAAVSEYKDGEQRLIQVQGTVKKVCEKEGCWMTLNDQDQTVRVFFKGHSFSVGRKLEGKKVVTEGTLIKKVQTVADQKHLLKDSGASEAEIAKVTSPLEVYQFEATGVKTI